ncbi:helix-turn-helix domain-containing protein [Bifidobacterium pseudolongum]|uniref:helix-turn-helix domain-containing protein n=1 Tax=Bifidobacterium pseudolongum TaxID=1694 RepID=UPI0020A07FFC|nr:helix-turn-helix domain-containing protein [Bifidobacterium pseudolongum]
MTAGTAERVYRLRDGRVTPAMGAVLTYLAFRAYYEDGRCAWPSRDTIAAATFLSRRTVIRALGQLIDLGYVRENPNQQWNQMDPETGEWKRKGYRTVVYDVLVERFEHVEDVSAERVRDELETAAGQGCQNVTPDETVGNTPIREGCQNVTPGSDASDRGDIVTGQGCHNVTQPTNNQQLPPTPTGYPPASGESPEQGDGRSGEDTGRGPGVAPTSDAGGDARRVCAHLAGVRRAAGLTCPDATGRDLAAVARLLERLRAAGVADPVARVCSAVDWAMGAAGGGYWRRRLRSGRRLADGWDELVDDMTLARDRSATQPSPAAVSCTAGHRADCEHMRGIGEAAEFVQRYPSFAVRHAHDRRLAALADDGLSRTELCTVLRGLLREDAQAQRVRAEQEAREKARIQQEVAAERARRGGSMFIGSRTYRGGAA